jgi:hypothetical protein
MSYQTVEAGRGIEWLKGAIQIAMGNPGVFLVMALIMAIIAIVPVLGAIALLVFGPALLGGFVWAIREHDQGRTAEIGQLFTAFQQPGKLGPMVMLCLPAVAFGVIMMVVLFLTMGAAIIGAATGGGDGGVGAAAAVGGAVIAGLVGLVLGIGLYLVMIFSIPRVMFDGIDPIAAMKESFAAALANIVAIIVYCVVTFIGMFVLALLIGWIPLVGAVAITLIAYCLAAGVIYLAYKDVFGVADAAPPAYVPPPAPPAPPAG